MAEEALPTFAPDQVMSDEADFDFEDKVGVEQDLSGDGGCKKTILKAGEGWEKPEKGDEVTVHYVGTLLDGTKFDSSRDRGEPFTFQLGEGRVIKGWDAGVATMKKGETANLVCRSDYAYGAAGSPPTIPPDATLQFEVELISWKSVKDITGDGGVIKTVVTEGQGWQNPKDQDEVVITYTARLRPAAVDSATKCKIAAEQGLPVVAQSPEGGLTFYIGEAPCSGFAVALKNMKPKESALVLLKPEYAAGMAEVPADQVLEVQLQLTELHQISTPAPGVSKKTLLEPEGSWNKPNDGSTVSISVTTKSADGATVYEPEKDVTFTTDEEQVPEGLELAISSMKAEEHAIITVTDPVLFRAPEGAVAGTSVPADATAVVYDVVLKSFQKAKEKWEMNNQEKLESALARKEKGNAAYKAGNLVRAARQYNAAVEAATSINERDYSPNPVAESASSSTNYVAQAKEVKKTCMNNWAAVELKRKNWAEAAKQATKVLELEPSNMKALYRRAQARIGLGELVEAEVDIRAGLLSEPDNTDLQALQRKLKVQMRELNKKEAKLYGKMFAALGKATAAAAEQDNAAPMEAEEQQQPSAAAAPVVEATA